MSQKELARRLELSEPRVSRLLNGRDNTTLRTLADVGHALGVRFALVPIPFEERGGTPAAEDPEPPRWVDQLRRELLAARRAAAPASKSVTQEKGQEMKRIDVVKKGNGWIGESGGATVRNTKAPTKEEAIKKTANVARKDPEAVSVRIHKVDGRIQEERTYPRSADPRRSKG